MKLIHKNRKYKGNGNKEIIESKTVNMERFSVQKNVSVKKSIINCGLDKIINNIQTYYIKVIDINVKEYDQTKTSKSK